MTDIQRLIDRARCDCFVLDIQLVRWLAVEAAKAAKIQIRSFSIDLN